MEIYDLQLVRLQLNERAEPLDNTFGTKAAVTGEATFRIVPRVGAAPIGDLVVPVAAADEDAVYAAARQQLHRLTHALQAWAQARSA